jgi:hypothetical protein
MARLSAKAVLMRMMQDFADNDIPSAATWADACRVVGRPAPACLVKTAGGMSPVGPGIRVQESDFVVPERSAEP